MDLKGGHLFTMFLCKPGFEPTTLLFLCCSTLKAPDDFKDFKYSMIRLSRFTKKI